MPQTIYKQSHHLAGSAPDTTPSQFDLKPQALRLDIAIFDNVALVSFSDDGIFFSTEREFPAGIITSLDLLCQSVRIRNKVPASVARYDITAFYSPVEVVGVPFSPTLLQNP
jgi:hypothetical protein